MDSELKQVTVLLSEMRIGGSSSGLGAGKVSLPDVLHELAGTAAKYDVISRIVGESRILVCFGVHQTQEGQALQALRFARELHERVRTLNRQGESGDTTSLEIRTSLTTDVIARPAQEKQVKEFLPSQALDMALKLVLPRESGQIWVDVSTYRLTHAHFFFEKADFVRTDRLHTYCLLEEGDPSVPFSRLSEGEGTLIGREQELHHLRDGLMQTKNNQGVIISISGDAGTGKSRLVREFRASLLPSEVNWLQGDSYAYSQNIPYALFRNLLARAFSIKDSDKPDIVRHKIEAGVTQAVGEPSRIVPWVGWLFSLRYPETVAADAETWRKQIRASFVNLFRAWARKGPLVVCLDDLHWADPSSVELLYSLLNERLLPVLFLCLYRPTFHLFQGSQADTGEMVHTVLALQDLSPSQARQVLASLLGQEEMPRQLENFIQSKAEGNPFYLEELFHSLVESGVLVRGETGWQLATEIPEVTLPIALRGMIAARLDRLEPDIRRVLHEASVVGRVFAHAVLKRISRLGDDLDRHLIRLEEADLIRIRRVEPDREYIFKHVLTQEAVYNGIFPEERAAIHAQVGRAIEGLYQDRLPEYWETLGFHFGRSHLEKEAVTYLSKAADKSWRQHALQEADGLLKEAYQIVTHLSDKDPAMEVLVFDLLDAWIRVHALWGTPHAWIDLFHRHQGFADAMEDTVRKGRFYCNAAMAFFAIGLPVPAYEYAQTALSLSEASFSPEIMAFARIMLCFTGAELGRLDEAVANGERARQLLKDIDMDVFMHVHALGAQGQAFFFKGDVVRASAIGRELLALGETHSDTRSLVLGNLFTGISHSVAGDFASASECYHRALEVASEPYYINWIKTQFALDYVMLGRIEAAELMLQDVMRSCQASRPSIMEPIARAYLGLLSLVKGQMSKGLREIQESVRECEQKERRVLHGLLESILGHIYLKLVLKEENAPFLVMVKNLGFLLRNVPVAARKAEAHFENALKIGKDTGSDFLLGHIYLGLGLLCKARGSVGEAREHLGRAIEIFETQQARQHLEQARAELSAMAC